MSKIEKPILNVLGGKKPSRTPVWLMRQAGRYLPEYRDLRSKAKDFLNLCLTPDYATEVTLQPIRRFNFDAAILFADILLVPMALGANLKFREGEGPILDAIQDEKSIEALHFENSRVLPVYETLARVKKELPAETTLIGFCGAPWTVACYMIDGNSKGGFKTARLWAAEKPELLSKLITVLLDASETYLSNQIEAGAETLQIFDSWAGLLKDKSFDRFVIAPTKELIRRIKGKYPHIKIIGFPREADQKGYYDYAHETGIDGLSIDFNLDLDYAKKTLQSLKPLQGNLDPALLVKGGDQMKFALEKILKTFGPQHILNLGHGVVPETPPENVGELVKFVHTFKF